MILIPRKIATLTALFIFLLSLLGSIFYFTNATYRYVSNLESKFQEVRSLYRSIERLTNESRILEQLKAEFVSLPDVFIEEEIGSEELKSKLEELLSGKLIATNYILLKSSIDEPIAFNKRPVKYTFILKSVY